MRLKLPSGYDPCGEVYEAIYFNKADVQKALQANTSHLRFHYILKYITGGTLYGCCVELCSTDPQIILVDMANLMIVEI
jgi:hypothetical protein